MRDKILFITLLIISIVIGILLIIFSNHIILPIFVGLFCLFILIEPLTKNETHKGLYTINRVINYIIAAFGLIITLVQPITLILSLLIGLFIITYALPFLLFKLILTPYLELGLTDATIHYISLCTSTISSTIFSKDLLHLIYSLIDKIGHFGNKDIFIKEWLELFYRKENVVFLIYTLYFIFLITWGFYDIQYENRALISPETDKVILKSFLVYIAFTSFQDKANRVQLKLNDILKSFIKIIILPFVKHRNKSE